MTDFVILLGSGTEPTAEQKQAAAAAIGGEVLDRDLYFVGKLSDDGTLTMSALAQMIIAMRYQPTVSGWSGDNLLGPIADRQEFKAKRLALLDQGAAAVETVVGEDNYSWIYRMPEQIPNPEPPQDFVRRHTKETITGIIKPLIEEYSAMQAKAAKDLAEEEYKAAVDRGKEIAVELTSGGAVL